MVNLTIDGKQISVEENTTIMEAARINGIPIPKLCYLKGINEIAACTNVIAEYQTDLANGQLNSADEVNQAVDEFVEKLNANGAEKIVAEVQSQIDAWQAAKAA